MRFLDFLFPPRDDEISLRDVPTDTFLTRIAPRLVPETRPETVVLLSFGDRHARAAVHEAKYHGSEHSFRLLAAVLTEYLRDDEFRKPILVPIPLGEKRLKERGFNQVEEITRTTARELGIDIDANLLSRTRETASQVSLPRRAREENMRGAFRATHPADAARTYIVIDDVLTTGATLQAAIDALQEAGAVHVVPLALAH